MSCFWVSGQGRFTRLTFANWRYSEVLAVVSAVVMAVVAAEGVEIDEMSKAFAMGSHYF